MMDDKMASMAPPELNQNSLSFVFVDWDTFSKYDLKNKHSSSETIVDIAKLDSS